jgi:hypothetical protein
MTNRSFAMMSTCIYGAASPISLAFGAKIDTNRGSKMSEGSSDIK